MIATKLFKDFVESERSGGIVLVCFTLLALVVANNHVGTLSGEFFLHNLWITMTLKYAQYLRSQVRYRNNKTSDVIKVSKKRKKDDVIDSEVETDKDIKGVITNIAPVTEQQLVNRFSFPFELVCHKAA